MRMGRGTVRVMRGERGMAAMGLGAALAGCAGAAAQAPVDAGDCDAVYFNAVPWEVLATEPRPACDDGAWVAWEGDLREPGPVRLVGRDDDAFVLEVGAAGAPRAEDVFSALYGALRQMRGVVESRQRCGAPDVEISVNLLRCATTLRAFAEQLAALPSTLPALRGRTVRVCARVAGERGPRCDPREASCLPTRGDPSEERPLWASRPPDTPRCPPRFIGQDLSGGMCQHDGECVVTGCGNRCVHWSLAPFSSNCRGLGEAVWCGCVSNRCAWFR